MTWTTMDGRRMNESEMSDSHLVNALTYLVRRTQEQMYFHDQFHEDWYVLCKLRDMPINIELDTQTKLVLSDMAEENEFLDLAAYFRGFVYRYNYQQAIRAVKYRYARLVTEANKRNLHTWKEELH